MQNYTRLKLNESENKLNPEREAEWGKAVSTAVATSGIGGGLFVEIGTIGIKFLNRLVDEIFLNEKTALSKGNPQLSGDYFQTLENEIMQVAQRNLNAIRSKHLSFPFIRRDAGMEKFIRAIFERNKDKYESIIKTNIEILKEELHLSVTFHSGTR